MPEAVVTETPAVATAAPAQATAPVQQTEPVAQTPVGQQPVSASEPVVDTGMGEAQDPDAQNEASETGMGEAKEEEQKDPNEGILGAPESGYDATALKLPEGVQIAPEIQAVLQKNCKELNLSQKSYQQLVENMAPAFMQRHVEQMAQMKTDFTREAITDPEIGGVHYKQNVNKAAKFFRKYFDPDTQKFLTQVGLDRYPGFIKGCLKAQKDLSDDQVVRGAHATGQIDRAKAFFPNSKMN